MSLDKEPHYCMCAAFCALLILTVVYGITAVCGAFIEQHFNVNVIKNITAVK